MYFVSKNRLIFLIVMSYFVGCCATEAGVLYPQYRTVRAVITAIVLATISRFILRNTPRRLV